MNNYQIQINLGAGWINLTDYNNRSLVPRESISCRRDTHNGGKSTVDTFSFSITDVPISLAQDIYNQKSYDLIDIVVDRNGARYFTGYLRPVDGYEATAEGLIETEISFEAVDTTWKLKKELDSDFIRNETSVDSIVRQLISEAGFTTSDINFSTTLSQVVYRFAADEEDEIIDAIDDLLFQYHHCIIAKEDGTFDLFDWLDDGSTPYGSFDQSIDSISAEKTDEDYGYIRIKHKEAFILTNSGGTGTTQIYSGRHRGPYASGAWGRNNQSATNTFEFKPDTPDGAKITGISNMHFSLRFTDAYVQGYGGNKSGTLHTDSGATSIPVNGTNKEVYKQMYSGYWRLRAIVNATFDSSSNEITCSVSFGHLQYEDYNGWQDNQYATWYMENLYIIITGDIEYETFSEEIKEDITSGTGNPNARTEEIEAQFIYDNADGQALAAAVLQLKQYGSKQWRVNSYSYIPVGSIVDVQAAPFGLTSRGRVLKILDSQSNAESDGLQKYVYTIESLEGASTFNASTPSAAPPIPAFPTPPPDLSDGITVNDYTFGIDDNGRITELPKPTVAATSTLRKVSLAVAYSNNVAAASLRVQLQISVDDTNWFSLGPGGDGADDWKGVANEVTGINGTSYVHDNLPLGSVSGNPIDTLYYYRARLATATLVSEWSDSVQATALPVLEGDIAADSVTADKINAGTLTAGTAIIDQLFADSANIEVLTSNEAFIEDLVGNNATFDTAFIERLTGENLNYETGFIQSLTTGTANIENGLIANLTAEEGFISRLVGDSATFDTAFIERLTGENLNYQTGFIQSLVTGTATATNGFITTLTSEEAFISNLTGDNATFNTAFIERLTGENLAYETGFIQSLTSNTATLENGFISNLTAEDAFITNLTGDNATFNTAFIERLTGENLNYQTGFIQSLVNGTASSDVGFIATLTSQTAFITDLFANEITIQPNGFIQSATDVSGNRYWKLDENGALIAGWTVNTDSISKGNATISSADEKITLGNISLDGINDELNVGTNFVFDYDSVNTKSTLTVGTGASAIRIDTSQGLWIGDSDFATAVFSATLDGEITAKKGSVGGFSIIDDPTYKQITSRTVTSGVPSGRGLTVDDIKNRFSVFSETDESVVMGQLEGLAKQNANETGTWNVDDRGFWVLDGDRLVIDGNVTINNGDWMIENDASYLIYNASDVVITRLGTGGIFGPGSATSSSGEKGLFINETASGTDYRSKQTASGMFVGNDDSYLSFENGGLTLKLTSFIVETDITRALGTFNVSRFGNIDALDKPLTFSTETDTVNGTTSEYGRINQLTEIRLSTNDTDRVFIDSTGVQVSGGNIVGDTFTLDINAGTSQKKMTSDGDSILLQTTNDALSALSTRLRIDGGANSNVSVFDAEEVEQITFDGDKGFVGINNTQPDYHLDVNGQLHVTDGLYLDKKDIQPKSILIYYGYPVGFNQLWSVPAVVDEIAANYNAVIFGNYYQDPAHESYADTQQIISGLRSKGVEVYGYVPLGKTILNLTKAEIETSIDQWDALNVHGIFLDEFGFDFNDQENPVDYRQRQIDAVTYTHDKGLVYMANSWEFGWVIFDSAQEVLDFTDSDGNQVYDTNSNVYQQTVTGNPNDKALPRWRGDGFLFENFFVHHTGLADQWAVHEKIFLFDKASEEKGDYLRKWATGVVAEPETPDGTIDTTPYPTGFKDLSVLSEHVWSAGMIHGMEGCGIHGYSFGSNTWAIVAPNLRFTNNIFYTSNRIQAANYTPIASRIVGDTEITLDYTGGSPVLSYDKRDMTLGDKRYIDNTSGTDFIGDVVFNDPVTTNDTFTAESGATFKSTANIQGAATLDTTLSVTGTSTFTGSATFNGISYFNDDLWIFDQGGNIRFLLGDSGVSGEHGGFRWVSTSNNMELFHSGTGGTVISYDSVGNTTLTGPTTFSNTTTFNNAATFASTATFDSTSTFNASPTVNAISYFNDELWIFNDQANIRFLLGDSAGAGDYGGIQWKSSTDSIIFQHASGGDLIEGKGTGEIEFLGTSLFSNTVEFDSTSTFDAAATFNAIGTFNDEVWLMNQGSSPRYLVGDEAVSGEYGGMRWNSTNNEVELFHSTSQDGLGNPSIILDSAGNTDVTYSLNVGTDLTVNTTSTFVGQTTFQSRANFDNELWIFNDGASTRFLLGDSATTGQWGGMQWNSTEDRLDIFHSTNASAGLQINGSGVGVGRGVTTYGLSTTSLFVDNDIMANSIYADDISARVNTTLILGNRTLSQIEDVIMQRIGSASCDILISGAGVYRYSGDTALYYFNGYSTYGTTWVSHNQNENIQSFTHLEYDSSFGLYLYGFAASLSGTYERRLIKLRLDSSYTSSRLEGFSISLPHSI